jgi:hypothetical protein
MSFTGRASVARLDLLRLVNVAVDQFDPVAACSDAVVKGSGHYDGSMPATGAADSDAELSLAFFFI